MADFKPTKIDISTINNGKGEYINGVDSVQADTINAVVEGVAWVQSALDKKIDTDTDQEIGGQKTFTKDIETKDRFVVLNKDATELISRLAGVTIKTGATSLLFKGLWEYKNNATNENTAINATTNITCYVKPNKPVVLFPMSKTFASGTKRLINNVNNKRFSNAVNSNGTETSGTVYTLSHVANSNIWNFNGEELTKSQLDSKYGIGLTGDTVVTTEAYDVNIVYLYGTGSFSLTRLSGIHKNYVFCNGNITLNEVNYSFVQLFTMSYSLTTGNGEFWDTNVTFDLGSTYNPAITVFRIDGNMSMTEAYDMLMYMFQPQGSYQTQTIPVAYSVVYDTATESLKIGYGYYNTAGEFILYDELSNSITTRADSTELTDGHILKWDSVKNRLVDSELSVDDIAKKQIIINDTASTTVTTSPNYNTEYHYKNIEYFYGELTALTLLQNGIPTASNAGDRFHISFKSGEKATTITIDNSYLVTPTTVGANKNVEIDGYCVYDGTNWRYSLKIAEV